MIPARRLLLDDEDRFWAVVPGVGVADPVPTYGVASVAGYVTSRAAITSSANTATTVAVSATVSASGSQ